MDLSKVGALPKVQHVSAGNLASLSAYHSPRNNSNNSSGNGNIVLTDGAIADFEGSGTLIPGYVQYLEPLRTANAHPTGGALNGGSTSRPGSRPNSAPMENNREDLSGAPALAAQVSRDKQTSWLSLMWINYHHPVHPLEPSITLSTLLRMPPPLFAHILLIFLFIVVPCSFPRLMDQVAVIAVRLLQP